MKVMVLLWARIFLVHDCESFSATVRTDAQLAMPRHLPEEAASAAVKVWEASSLGADISNLKRGSRSLISYWTSLGRR